jgi:hypothetical protein
MINSAPASARPMPMSCSGPIRSMPRSADSRTTTIGDNAMISAIWIAVVEMPAM